MSSACELTYVVEGMDCASCTAKIERIVAGMSGAEQVKTNFGRSTLSLLLDETKMTRAQLEAHLKQMGYTPTLQHDSSVQAPQKKPTYRELWLTGGLLALAWIMSWWGWSWGYAVATLVGVWPRAKTAWVSARLGEPFGIHLLVTLAALGALFIGEAPEGAAVVFLFSVGEWLESLAAARARSGIQALHQLSPKIAFRLDGQAVTEIPIEDLRIGDVIQVGAGERVAADGIVLAGCSSLDESHLTGESRLLSKGIGDEVMAGSINAEGVLHLRVTRAARDTTLARMIALVEEAEASKAPTARWIDRFSRVYTPLVLLGALLVAVVPVMLGFGWEWVYRGIALLLIGCPCALVLSVPATMTSGIAAGARHGLLVKGGAVLEALVGVKTVAFDKTGTLTLGQPQVVTVAGESRAEVLGIAAAVERGSRHPLGRAIEAWAQKEGVSIPASSHGQVLPGRGVSAWIDGAEVGVFSPRAVPLVGALAQQVLELEQSGQTVVLLLKNDVVIGLIGLRDAARPEAKSGVACLGRLGLRSVMLTGDQNHAAQLVGAEVGLRRCDIWAGLLPQDKLRLIRQASMGGGVVMVGDGVNDAPALTQADVGIAMGSGTDVAMESADAAILSNRVSGVAELIDLSRASMTIIRQNIWFALGLKAIFLVGILLGYTNLWMAVLADTGATALVTANSLRLLRWKPKAMTAEETTA